MAARIEECKSVQEIFMMIEKPYYFVFIKFAKPYLSRVDLSNILSSAWSMVEQSNMDANLTKAQLVSLFKQCDKSVLMDEAEYKAYQEFPATVNVYRGLTNYNKKNIRALSWSLDRKVAEWFSNRFKKGEGKVYSATIDKEHILAFFSGRGEAEVIVDPKYLLIEGDG